MFVATGSPCEICSSIHDIQLHHIQSRGMGGSRNPQRHSDANRAWLCAACHRQITENRWEFTRTDNCLQVVDKATGRQLMRRLFSAGLDVVSYFEELNSLDRGFEAIILGIPYLTDEQLIEVFQYLRSMGKHAWKAQAAILWEAKQRSVYGDRAWEAMGRSFGIGWRQAYNLARVWEVFFKGEEGTFCNQLQSSLEESTWYVVAAGTDNPHFWLAYAEDRKAENPAYTTSDFREEIRIAGAQREDFEAPPGSEKPRCHWLRTYCMKLGRIVRPVDCSRCDIPITSPEEADHDNDDQ